MNPQEYAKAIVGGILAGLVQLGVALTDGSVSAAEWVGVAVATLTVFSSVFGIPNAPKKDTVATQKVTVETVQTSVAPAVSELSAADLADGADHAEIPLATPESDPEDATVTGL